MLVGFLIVFCLFVLGFAAVFMTVAEKRDAGTEVQFEKEYEVGETVKIPDLRLEQDGKYFDAEKKVTCPDGTVFTGDSLEIFHQGVYEVKYSAVTENGETLQETHTFEGYYPLYGMDKKNSSAYYGASEKYGGIEGRDGVVVSLASGDSFRWNEVIDLRDHTMTDHLVELYVTPNMLGTADARNLCFVLTDVYDPDNYVTVMAKKVTAVSVGAAWAEQQTFVTAGANGQLQMGMRKDDGDKDFVIYEGERYGREIGNKMGTTVPNFSLPGVPKYVQNDASSVSEKNFLENPQILTLSFNFEKSVVYAGNGEKDILVADLDAEECFDTLWGGFTTGEVYLSIKGTEYLSSSLNFVITKIDGEDVGNKAAAGNKIVDKEAPVLTVNVPQTVPEAVVDVPYSLFSATANDLYDGKIEPKVTVTSAGKEVEVSDGKFIPEAAATYIVTYTASDYSGNMVSREVSVTAKRGRTLSITLADAPAGEFLTGTLVPVAEYTASNVSGTLNMKITAIRVADGKGNSILDGERYEVKDGKFCPMYDGKYRIEYQASDYLVPRVIRSYEMTVGINPDVVIIGEAELPRYYISGMVYETPSLLGYWFDESGPHEVVSEVSWSADGVSFTKANDLFAPVANGTLTLRFVAAYKDKTEAVKMYTVDAQDVGYNDAKLRIKDYFKVTSGSALVGAESDKILVAVDGQADLVFINTLQTASFSFRYSVGKIGQFSIRLTAADDEEKMIEVGYTDLKTGKMSVTASVMGASYTKQFNYNAGDELVLRYYDSSRKLQVTDKLAIDLSEDFVGFGGKVWMDVSFAEGGEAQLYELNGQLLTNISADRIKPMIVVDVEAGDRMLNDVYHVEKCTIADVLDTYVIAYMYMTTPYGGFAKATDGTVLDGSAYYGREYDILLDQYGVYTVYYYAKDTAGNQQTFTFQVTVVDSFPPTIVTAEKNRFVALGGEIKPAKYEVKDDLSSEKEIRSYVCIIRPDGSGVSGVTSVKATMKGVYKIIYYAIDAYGNTSTLTYEITVY